MTIAKQAVPLLLLALTLPASAQTPPPPDTDPAKIEAGLYAVEPSHTRVLFAVSHMGFTNYYGQFTGASGSLTIDPKKVSKSEFDIVVPSATVSTTNEKLDGELKDDKWLDVAKYPAIEFKSVSVKTTGADTADVTGNLTLHGVTKPVTLKATFNAGGINPLDKRYTIGFQLSGTIKRSDFGVTTYVPLIGDSVDLIIAAAFEKQG